MQVSTVSAFSNEYRKINAGQYSISFQSPLEKDKRKSIQYQLSVTSREG
jgi:hypothetical protein